MAETSAVRKSIKLRIKLPGKAQQQHPASQPPALPQQQGPSSKPSAAVPPPPQAPAAARRCKKRRLLDGYVPPDAQPAAIVECLRRGEQFSPLQLVPPWDLSLALPTCQRGTEGSRAKRGRTQESACAALRDSQNPGPAAEAAAPLQQSLPPSEPAQPFTLLPPQQQSTQHVPAQKLQEEAQVKAEPPRAPQAAQMQEDPSGTSSSDNTTSIALGPGAPTNHSPQGAAAGASCSPETALRDSIPPHHHLAPSAAVAGQPASAQQQQPELLQGLQHHDQQQPLRSARSTAACSTQACLGPAGSSSILPSSLMQLRYARMSDVTTRDLRMPLPRQPHRSTQQRHQHQQLTDKTVEGLLATAQSQKREVDARRGTEGQSVLHVAAYAQSALKFMEACEAMVKLPRTPERLASIGRLYVQTSDLLNFTVRVADSVRDTSCARDALGVLCKRLSAVCLAREAALLPHRMAEYANRVQQLLHRSSAVASQTTGPAPSQSNPPAQTTRSTGAHATTTTTTNAKGQPQHPSPDDSTTSSQDQIALSQPQHPHHQHHQQHHSASAGRPPPPSARPAHPQHHPHTQHQQQQSHPQQALLPADMRAKLLLCARHIVRGGEQLKRTTHGFQALTERADVQQSRTARLACIHIAAVSMDYGLAEQGHARAHALQAIQHIREISKGS